MDEHPHPWRVAYDQKCDEWHPKSLPRVVDANGETVCTPKQNVPHPGLYDKIADETAQAIATNTNTVNAQLTK